jgi:hypothetical protein
MSIKSIIQTILPIALGVGAGMAYYTLVKKSKERRAEEAIPK